MEPVTFIGCPTHNGELRGEIVTAILDAAMGNRMAFAHSKYSKLTQNFNFLICDALNLGKFTHFCMIHGDIVPAQGWLKTLHKEMEETGADVISAVVPIKNPKGITSTGLCKEETTPLLLRRLTLKECLDPAKLANLGLSTSPSGKSFTGDYIILNTGLMLIDLRKDWIKQITFRVTDQIIVQPDGTRKAFGGSEDWLFSLDARKLGAKLWATTAVKLNHVGGATFSNYEAYGNESEGWHES